MKDQIERIEAYAKDLSYGNDSDAAKLGDCVNRFSRLIREHREQVKVPEIKKKILESEFTINGWLMEFVKDKNRQAVYYDRAQETFLQAIEDLKPFFDIGYATLRQQQEKSDAAKSKNKLPKSINIFRGIEEPGTFPYDIHIPMLNEKLCVLEDRKNLPFSLSVPITCLLEMLNEMELELNLRYDGVLQKAIPQIKQKIESGIIDINFIETIERCGLKYWVEECGYTVEDVKSSDDAVNPKHAYFKFMKRLLTHFCYGGEIVLFDKRINNYVGEIEFTAEKSWGYFHYGEHEIVKAYTIVV